MRRLEKLATVWMGRHLEAVRHKKRLSAREVASRLGMRPDNYRTREMGRVIITLSFLLRVQLALNVPIESLWFPFRRGVGTPDESTTAAAFANLLEHMASVTVEQVLEITAEAFQVPVGAIASGLGHKRLRQARTAAALVIESIPHLKLVDLSRLVCRTPRTLYWTRRQAQEKSDKGFWGKVAAIRREVSTL